MTAIVGALDTAFDVDDPPPLDEVLGAAFVTVQRIDADQGFTKLALQVWSETLPSPVLAETLTREISRIRASLTRLVQAYQAQGRMTGGVPAEHSPASWPACCPASCCSTPCSAPPPSRPGSEPC